LKSLERNIAGLATILAAGALAPTAHAASPLPAQAPAPVGVFGVDMPADGKLVFLLQPSFTRMQGIQIGTRSVSPEYIVSNVISPRTPVGTHLLRLVPHNLSVDTQGFGLAYGLNRDVTLSVATSVVEKSVNMAAFKGLSGLTVLGSKVGSTQGFGDTTVAAVVRLHRDKVTQFNINFGMSLPSGGITDDFFLLLPNNTAPKKRAFYAMQPGTGTYDALLGAAYSGVEGPWSWGMTYRARLPTGVNAEGWRYGDLHEANAWGGYTWAPGVETTLRLNAATQTAIHGLDKGITGYAQGSNPAFYGGTQFGLYAGVLVSGRYFGVPASQVGVEAGAPVYQNLNGPQLARDWQVNLALKYKL
jgi:hypothetical protein